MRVDFDAEKSRIGEIKSTEIVDACILGVDAGTNCPQGGDWGHGGRTYLALKDVAGVGWAVRITGWDGEVITIDQPREVEILLGGDAEHRCIVKALAFARAVLRGAPPEYLPLEDRVGDLEARLDSLERVVRYLDAVVGELKQRLAGEEAEEKKVSLKDLLKEG